MLFAIYCLDKAGHGALRAANRAAHLDYLRANEAHIIVVGPLLDDSGENPIGSLLVMDFESRTAAEDFADGDPYAKAGLFESVTIRPWRKVFPAD